MAKDAFLPLTNKILACRGCGLHGNKILGRGHDKSKIMLISEAPTQEDCASGKPFVGRCGMLLSRMLVEAGIDEDDLYITNIVKCSPPNNRKPKRDEIDACKRFLAKELWLIKPIIVIALGQTAASLFMQSKEKIGKLVGQEKEQYYGYTVIPAFHPAYILRNPSRKDPNKPYLRNLAIFKDIKERFFA